MWVEADLVGLVIIIWMVEALVVVVVVVEALVVVVVDGLITEEGEAVAEVLIWLGHVVARAIAGAAAGAIAVVVAGAGHAQGVVALGVVVINGAEATAVVLVQCMKEGIGDRVFLGLILNHQLSLS